MRLEISADEMLLALVSMIQVTRPALLRPAGDGFDVDISPLVAQKELNDQERLVLRLYGVYSGGSESTNFAFDVTLAERDCLARALAVVASSRAWPADAVAVGRSLAARLA